MTKGMSMKLTVLYEKDGRIVSLSRQSMRTGADDSGIPPLRSGVEPAKGQRVAVIELDPAWCDRPLRDIHEQCTVVQNVRGPRLKEGAKRQDRQKR